MQILVSNTLTGDRQVSVLPGAAVWIGRPPEAGDASESPGIILASRLVSRRQARLVERDGGWWLEHHGRNPTYLKGRPVVARLPQAVEPDDEIRIGEYLLTLLSSRGDDGLEPTADARMARFMDLNQAIHKELLQRMDLRRGEGLVELADPVTRTRIHHLLDQILADSRFQPGDADAEALAPLALNRRLSQRIMRAGSSALAERAWRLGGAPPPYEALLTTLESRLIRKLGLTLQPKTLAEDFERLERDFVGAYRQFRLELTPAIKASLVVDVLKRDTLDLVFGLGPLQDLMDADAVSEIMVVNAARIFVEKFGVIEDAHRSFFSDEALMSVIERIVAPVGRRIDRSTPLVDARLPDGSRVNAVIPPIAVRGPCLTIRKFSLVPLGIDDLVRLGAISVPMVKFLHASVETRKNVIVSGGTGTGKTTLLNALSRFIPIKERVVTIEDTAELRLQREHVVTLEARPPNLEGRGEITIRDLVKNALRMRPDRIVVGECRGGETLDMLQAMNTGHDGSMTTGHANSPEDMMLRLETLVLTGTAMPIPAIRAQIASALDLVVQITRFPDGARRVTRIAEVTGIDEETGLIQLEAIFIYRPAEGERDGRYLHTGYIPSFVAELLARGAMTLDTFF